MVIILLEMCLRFCQFNSTCSSILKYGSTFIPLGVGMTYRSMLFLFLFLFIFLSGNSKRSVDPPAPGEYIIDITWYLLTKPPKRSWQ